MCSKMHYSNHLHLRLPLVYHDIIMVLFVIHMTYVLLLKRANRENREHLVSEMVHCKLFKSVSIQRSLPLSTYCETAQFFLMVISMTLTSFAERLAVELSLPVLTI